MLDNPLGDNLGHDLMNALAALEAQGEGERICEVSRVGGGKLVGGVAHCRTDRGERSKNMRGPIIAAILLAPPVWADSPDISARRLQSARSSLLAARAMRLFRREPPPLPAPGRPTCSLGPAPAPAPDAAALTGSRQGHVGHPDKPGRWPAADRLEKARGLRLRDWAAMSQPGRTGGA